MHWGARGTQRGSTTPLRSQKPRKLKASGETSAIGHPSSPPQGYERRDWEKGRECARVKSGPQAAPPSRAADPTETWYESLQTAIQKKQSFPFQNHYDHCRCIRMAKLKQLTTPRAEKDGEQLECSHTDGGNVRWYSHLRKQVAVSYIVKLY